MKLTMDLHQNISIKKLKFEDLETIKMFHVEHFQKFYYISENSWLSYLIFPQYETRGIFYNNLLVGYLIILKSLDCVDIIYITILPSHRKKGLGRYLLEDLFKLYKKNIFLEVSKNNDAALQLYYSMNFEILNIRKNYKNSQDFYLMMKKHSCFNLEKTLDT